MAAVGLDCRYLFPLDADTQVWWSTGESNPESLACQASAFPLCKCPSIRTVRPSVLTVLLKPIRVCLTTRITFTVPVSTQRPMRPACKLLTTLSNRLLFVVDAAQQLALIEFSPQATTTIQ